MIFLLALEAKPGREMLCVSISIFQAIITVVLNHFHVKLLGHSSVGFSWYSITIKYSIRIFILSHIGLYQGY